MLVASPSRAISLEAGENIVNSRALLRLCAWGSGAMLALVVAVMAGRTELGAQRAHAALTAWFSPPPSPDQQMSEQMMALSSGFDKQMRRQAEVIGTLAEQRDSLDDKVGALERQLSDLGGTLARTTARFEGDIRSAQQAAAAASAVAASVRVAQVRPEPVESAPPAAVAAHTPLTASPVRTVPATQPAPQGAPINILPPGQIHPAATTAAGFPTAGGPQTAAAYTGAIPMATMMPEANGPPGMMRPFPVQAPPAVAAADPWSAVPPRPNSAKAPPPAASVHAPPFQLNPLMTAGIFDTPPEPIATEFAIDLGAAPTVEALRGRWSDLRISQSPLLDNLRPLVALKDAKSGQELHLIAGPLTNNSAGARLCAVLSGSGVICQPAMYEGQRLTAR
jgi:hypothetical protein